MFKLARLVLFVVLGVYLGFKLSDLSMRAQCERVNGSWQDGLCLVTEISE